MNTIEDINFSELLDSLSMKQHIKSFDEYYECLGKNIPKEDALVVYEHYLNLLVEKLPTAEHIDLNKWRIV